MACDIVHMHIPLFPSHPIQGLVCIPNTFSSLIYFWRISCVKAVQLGTLKVLNHSGYEPLNFQLRTFASFMCTHRFQTTTPAYIFDFHKFEITHALAHLNTKPRIDPAIVNTLSLPDRLG